MNSINKNERITSTGLSLLTILFIFLPFSYISGQDILFSDDFENGLCKWDLSGKGKLQDY